MTINIMEIYMNKLHKFTLIEMLIVLAVLGILVTLLLPSLNKARREAVFVLCMSNLKQNGMAITQHSTKNDYY